MRLGLVDPVRSVGDGNRLPSLAIWETATGCPVEFASTNLLNSGLRGVPVGTWASLWSTFAQHQAFLIFRKLADEQNSDFIAVWRRMAATVDANHYSAQMPPSSEVSADMRL